jgi:hypothetical protein
MLYDVYVCVCVLHDVIVRDYHMFRAKLPKA